MVTGFFYNGEIIISRYSLLGRNPIFAGLFMDKKLNFRYGIIITAVLTVQIMLIFSFCYQPLIHDSRPIYTYGEIAEKGYREWIRHLKNQAHKKEIQLSQARKISSYEKMLKDSGMVDVQETDPDIQVGLRYSSKNNFMGKDLYGELDKCYLQKEVAEKLALASKYLHEKCSYYNLKVLDGVRPLHIQQLMWDSLNMTREEKLKYVSPPSFGSLHNYGCAVDVTFVNYEGWEADMGTDFDYFGELGHPKAEDRMINEGKLTYRQLNNRRLLREVMYKAGFTGLGTEWWHFNACGMEEARRKYHIVY